MADSTPDKSQQQLADRTPEERSAGVPSQRLSCQWCSVVLPEGETICPTCGSPGQPDEAMIVPGSEILETSETPPEVEPQSPEQIEAILEDEPANLYRNSSADAPEPIVVIAAIGGAVLITTIMGVIAAPLLATPMENTLGLVIDNPADLRPLGGVIGMLVGMFLGAIAMWVAVPRR